jgi:hypothetical protein
MDPTAAETEDDMTAGTSKPLLSVLLAVPEAQERAIKAGAKSGLKSPLSRFPA